MAKIPEDLVTHASKLVAYSIWIKYQAYCPRPLDLFHPMIYIGNSFQNYETVAFEYWTPILNALEKEYEIQHNKKKNGQNPYAPVDDMPVDDAIIKLSWTIKVDDLMLRRCIETLIKRPAQFKSGINEMIERGMFQELAYHITNDLGILDTSELFNNSQNILNICGASNTQPVPRTAANIMANTSANYQLSALKTTINTLRDFFFDIPVRQRNNPRGWRYTNEAVRELEWRRQSGPDVGPSEELKAIIQEKIDASEGLARTPPSNDTSLAASTSHQPEENAAADPELAQ